MRLVKNLEISTGHRLHLHQGGCYNLHGHNYQITVTVDFLEPSTEYIGGIGFNIDFGDIKKLINNNFDHKFLIYKGDPLLPSLEALNLPGLTVVDYAPTAENISTHIALILKEYFVSENQKNLKISIELYETANSKVLHELTIN